MLNAAWIIFSCLLLYWIKNSSSFWETKRIYIILNLLRAKYR
jgi:hypothetical protein